MMTRSLEKVLRIELPAIETFEDAENVFEWYTGMPNDMGRIEPLRRFCGIQCPQAFLHYMVWMDDKSPGCLSVQ